MSEASSTIIVDTSPRAPIIPIMSKKRRRSSVCEQQLAIKNEPPRKKIMPRSDTEQKVAVRRDDAETKTYYSRRSPIPETRSSTRKRKRVVHLDETYDTGCLVTHAGKEYQTGRPEATKRSTKTRTPVMGVFKLPGMVDSLSEKASSITQDLQQVVKEAKQEEYQDPWEAELFQKEYEAISTAKIKQPQELSASDDFPPPSDWYAGVPRANSRWTVCIRPPKPTWYHPDWDANRRKQADEATAALVKRGEEVLKADMDDRRYRVRETDMNMVTRDTVTWYQCHWFPTGKRWVFNISLDGYDEC